MAVVFASAVLASCSNAASTGTTGERITGLKIDPQTGYVKRISMMLPVRFLGRSPPIIFVKSQAGETTAWHPSRVTRRGGTAILELRSSATSYRPKVNDTVVAYFNDDATGDQHVLRASVLPGVDDAIVNRRFVAWERSTSPAAPVGWSAGGDSNDKYVIAPLSGAGYGVHLSVAPTNLGPARIESVALVQSVKVADHKIRVRLKPYQDCRVAPPSAGGNIVRFAGFAVSDGLGHEALFCITSAPRGSIRKMPGGMPMLAILPGHVNAWNDLTVDLRTVARYVRFKADAQGKLVFQVLVAVASSQPAARVSEADFASVDPSFQGHSARSRSVMRRAGTG